MSGSDMRKSKEPVRGGRNSGGSSKGAGSKVEGSSEVGMRLWSGSVTGTGHVEGGGSIAPARMVSAPGMDRLLHNPEDPVVPRRPPKVPTGLSVPSEESSFAAVGMTPERGSFPAPSRTQVRVDPRAISNPTETELSNTFEVTRGDTPRDSLDGGMTWDPPSDDMRRPFPKHPPLVGPGVGGPGLPETDRSMTEKREKRIERRERERREEDERDRVAR